MRSEISHPKYCVHFCRSSSGDFSRGKGALFAYLYDIPPIIGILLALSSDGLK